MIVSSNTLDSIKLVPTGDQTTTLDTAGNITGLSTTVEANHVYEISGCIHLGCNNTGGVKFAITTPAGATLFIQFQGFLNTSTAFVGNALTASATLTANAYCTVNNANGRVIIKGTVTVAGTAGTLQLQFASGTAGQTSTIYQEGSVLTVTKIS